MRTNFTAIILILLFSAVVSLPLLKPGFYLIHDDQQIARLYLLDESLKSGHFPARWVSELGFGFGYPLFVFYPPLVYYFGEIFHLLGAGFIDSIKIIFFLSIFLSGLAMYVFIKEIYGRLEGLVAATFYMLVPYRALDVYVRGALAESFSFVWLPLILLAFYKLRKDHKLIYSTWSAIFLALLMTTHNLVFLPFMLILPIYLIYLTLMSKNRKHFIVYSLLSIVYSFLLSAFFWIPALIEKRFTIVDNLLLTDLANYRIHFVYPTQLWNWTWGFGGSAAGLADGISFKIGKLHILASIAALFLAALHLRKNKSLTKLSIVHPERSRRLKTLSVIEGITFHFSLFTFGLFIFSAFMTTFYSKFIWETIKPLAYLQFPWRFLTFAALFSSTLAGAFIFLLRISFLKLIFAAVLIVLILAGNTKLFQPQSYRETLTDNETTTKETITWDVSKSSFEYIPKGIDIKTDEFGTRIPPIEKTQIPTQKVEVAQGVASISNIQSQPSKLKFTADVTKPSKITLNIFNFPGWVVNVDASPVSINSDNPLKLISFVLNPGLHNVEAIYTRTKIRLIADTISLVSITALAVLILKSINWPNFNVQKR